MKTKPMIISSEHSLKELEMLCALLEIEKICSESNSECRKRMGTRAGNSLVVARAAIVKAKGL